MSSSSEMYDSNSNFCDSNEEHDSTVDKSGLVSNHIADHYPSDVEEDESVDRCRNRAREFATFVRDIEVTVDHFIFALTEVPAAVLALQIEAIDASKLGSELLLMIMQKHRRESEPHITPPTENHHLKALLLHAAGYCWEENSRGKIGMKHVLMALKHCPIKTPAMGLLASQWPPSPNDALSDQFAILQDKFEVLEKNIASKISSLELHTQAAVGHAANAAQHVQNIALRVDEMSRRTSIIPERGQAPVTNQSERESSSPSSAEANSYSMHRGFFERVSSMFFALLIALYSAIGGRGHGV